MEPTASDTGRDISFQQKEWTVQRFGWAVMLLIVLLAALGLLGTNGPFASASVEAPDGSMRVSYLRFDRRHGPGEMKVTVAPEFVHDGEIRLWLDNTYASRFGIERIVPEPESTVVEPDRVVYVFAVGEQNGPLTIDFFDQHDGYWREQARLGLVDGERVELSQFLFP